MNVRPLTVWDIEAFYKGYAGHPFLDLGDLVEFEKTAGTVSTGIGTAVYNKVYGAYVWSQLNQEANAFGLLPKTTWVRSGWRVKTAFATSDEDIGIAETDTLPSAVYPTVTTVYASPKTEVMTFEVSDITEQLANVSEDDIWGSANQLRAETGVEFAKRINQQLLKDCNTLAGNRIESIDRVTASSAYITAVGYDAGDEDIYGIDRSANSWADATCLHNSGTDRDITATLVRDLLRQCKEAGANTTVLVTGYDTVAKIQGLYNNMVRYLPMQDAKITTGLNGIESARGYDVGITVSAVEGIPLIGAVDTPKDTISRIYALDTSDPEGYGLPRLAISVLRPSEYYETRDPFVVGKFAIKGVYRFVGELVARFLKAQGSLRDLK